MVKVEFDREVNTGMLATELTKAFGGSWKVKGAGKRPGYAVCDQDVLEQDVADVIASHDETAKPPVPPTPQEVLDAEAVIAKFEQRNPGVISALKTLQRWGR